VIPTERDRARQKRRRQTDKATTDSFISKPPHLSFSLLLSVWRRQEEEGGKGNFTRSSARAVRASFGYLLLTKRQQAKRKEIYI
jgi:hypothetical protein